MLPDRKVLDNSFKRVVPFVHRTPILESSYINDLMGCKVFFKCENFQRTGSFKMRGAINAILQLTDEQKEKGVITHSSGNFAQAISLAAYTLGVKAFVVMPSNANEVKKSAVRNYGGIITFSEGNLRSREHTTSQVQEKTGATFLHPSNNMNVLLGQGTATIELLAENPELNSVLVPVGGGGLIAGTALAAYYYGNKCKVIGGEPHQVDDAYRSLISGKIEKNNNTETIADGLRTHLGDINFPIIKEGVSEIIRVEEIEIVHAMKLIWNRLKIIIEPSSAVPVAALIKEKEKFKDDQVGIILSGGNVDLTQLPF